jgi:hypothetical protein
MVLSASSTDVETSPEEPTHFLKPFCKIQKISDAQAMDGVLRFRKGSSLGHTRKSP